MLDTWIFLAKDGQIKMLHTTNPHNLFLWMMPGEETMDNIILRLDHIVLLQEWVRLTFLHPDYSAYHHIYFYKSFGFIQHDNANLIAQISLRSRAVMSSTSKMWSKSASTTYLYCFIIFCLINTGMPPHQTPPPITFLGVKWCLVILPQFPLFSHNILFSI